MGGAESVLVPARLVGMTFGSTRPVDDVWVRDGTAPSDDPTDRSAVLEAKFADQHDLPPEGTILVAGGPRGRPTPGSASPRRTSSTRVRRARSSPPASSPSCISRWLRCRRSAGTTGWSTMPFSCWSTAPTGTRRGTAHRRDLRARGRRNRLDPRRRRRRPGALRGHRQRPTVLERPVGARPLRRRARRVQPDQPDRRSPAPRDRHRDGTRRPTADNSPSARCSSASRSPCWARSPASRSGSSSATPSGTSSSRSCRSRNTAHRSSSTSTSGPPLLGIAIPIVASALPVWRALRVEPIEAIRTGHLAAQVEPADRLDRPASACPVRP